MFYDGADYETDSDDSDDAREAEEAEAKRLQAHRAKLLQSSDFLGEEDDEAAAELEQPKRKAGKDKQQQKKKERSGSVKGVGTSDGGEDDGVERLSKDMSLLNDEQKLQLLISDAPELLELLSSFTASLKEIRSQIAPLLTQVRAGALPTSNGSSFLEVKFHLCAATRTRTKLP